MVYKCRVHNTHVDTNIQMDFFPILAKKNVWLEFGSASWQSEILMATVGIMHYELGSDKRNPPLCVLFEFWNWYLEHCCTWSMLSKIYKIYKQSLLNNNDSVTFNKIHHYLLLFKGIKGLWPNQQFQPSTFPMKIDFGIRINLKFLSIIILKFYNTPHEKVWTPTF